MEKKLVSFIEAVSVLVGTVIGAGILGIPFAAAKVGWVIATIYLVALGALLMGLNLLLGEIVARTKRPLQIPGLAAKYLGPRGKMLISFTTLFGGYGALLAYVIGEGQVLSALFGGEAFWWSLVFWSVGSLAVFFGLGLIKKLDVLLTLVVFTCLAIIVFYTAPSVRWPNLVDGIDWNNLFLPFGVFLFALMGAGAIPQVEDILPGQQKRLKSAIIVGSLIPVLVYFIFMTVIVGVTGASTTEVATVGLGQSLGRVAVIVGSIFALFTMGTCFLNISMSIKRQYEWDHDMSRSKAWLLTVFVPVIFFLIGVRNFIQTIGFLGAVFGSLNAIAIVLIYWQAKKKGDYPARKFGVQFAGLLSILIILVFTAGAVLTVWGLI